MHCILNTARTIFSNTAMVLAVGGAVGTNARYWLGRWLDQASWRAHNEWLSALPVGTFTINVTGSFVLGLLGVIFLGKLPEEHRAWFLLLGTGLCGGYTTFSTFEWETLQLLRTQSYWMAAANVLGSVAVGLVGVVLGAALGEWIYRNV